MPCLPSAACSPYSGKKFCSSNSLLWCVCYLQGPRDSLGSYSRMGTMSPAKSAVRECLLGQLHDMYISLCKQVSRFV